MQLWEARPTTAAEGYDRGTFACVGSDGRLYDVSARITPEGELLLTLPGGRRLRRLMRGTYFTRDYQRLRLDCDHPDAP